MSKKTCPVCSELSDQCLLCNSYVVDGERIYYNEIKNYGAIEEYELQFIEHIHKHHVVAFFHKGKLYIPSRQGRSVPLAIGLQWSVWQLKQVEIDQLKAELALCREENKGLVGKVSELKKHAEMLVSAAKSWTYSEGEKNILLSQADDLDRILNGEKALRCEHEN